MLKGITLTDRIKVPTQRKFTDSGQMIVPCAFARTGSQTYSAKALGMTDVKPETLFTVLRDEADVFDEDSMASFRSVPVTIGHPVDDAGKKINVTADNAEELQVGVLEGLPTRDENRLSGNLVIARQDAIDTIEDGTSELSAGYTCDIEVVTDEAGDKTYHQRNIRANHIAIVDKGRAGTSVRIADEEVELVPEEESTKTESKAECKDITPEVVDEEEPTVEETVETVTKELKVGDEGYEVYSALMMLNDEIKAVNDYVSAIDYCEDEALKSVFAYILKEEQDHCVKILDWLSSQDTSGSYTDGAEEALAKAKVIVDSIEEPAVAKEDVVVTDELEEANSTIARLTDELDAGVEARVKIILVAKDLTDLDDFSGKSNDEIRKLVVADLMPKLVLEGKSEAYINARFDILCEDAVSGETSMSKVLRKSATVKVTDAGPVDVVAEARNRMIKRQTAKS